MLRRILSLSALLLLALVIVASMAACAGKPAPTTPAKTTTAAPATTSKPATTTAAPATTSKPATTTAAPATTTAAPATTTAAPATTTAAPAATTAPDLVEANLTHLTFPNPDNLAQMASDSLRIDQEAHRLYVADYRGKYLNVFDISKPAASFVQVIHLSGPPMVIAVASEIKRLYTANNDGTVSVIDVDPASKTANTEIALITTPPKVALDGSGYIPGLKKVYITDTRNGVLYVIDATTNKIIKTVDKLGENIEPAYYNPVDKMVYLGVESDDTMLKFDPNTDTQVGKYATGAGSQVTHIAINTGKNIGVLGSANAKAHIVTVWDFATEKIRAVTDKSGSIDNIVYSPSKDMFFGFSSSYRPDPTKFKTFPIVSIFDGNGNFLANVPAPPGGRGAFDETNGLVYTIDTSKPVIDLVSFPVPDLTKKAPAATTAAPATTSKPAATTTAPAATTAAPAAGNTITWEEALKPDYLGKEVTVTGPVVQVVQAFGTKVNVYLGQKSVPDGDTQVGFCILVQDPSLLPSVKDTKGINAAWMGKTLEVTGIIMIDERHGTIQITATDDSQVKVD